MSYYRSNNRSSNYGASNYEGSNYGSSNYTSKPRKSHKKKKTTTLPQLYNKIQIITNNLEHLMVNMPTSTESTMETIGTIFKETKNLHQAFKTYEPRDVHKNYDEMRKSADHIDRLNKGLFDLLPEWVRETDSKYYFLLSDSTYEIMKTLEDSLVSFFTGGLVNNLTQYF